MRVEETNGRLLSHRTPHTRRCNCVRVQERPSAEAVLQHPMFAEKKDVESMATELEQKSQLIQQLQARTHTRVCTRTHTNTCARTRIQARARRPTRARAGPNPELAIGRREAIHLCTVT